MESEQLLLPCPEASATGDIGESFEAVADEEERVRDATVLDVGEHAHPELRPLTSGPDPQPEDVLLPG